MNLWSQTNLPAQVYSVRQIYIRLDPSRSDRFTWFYWRANHNRSSNMRLVDTMNDTGPLLKRHMSRVLLLWLVAGLSDCAQSAGRSGVTHPSHETQSEQSNWGKTALLLFLPPVFSKTHFSTLSTSDQRSFGTRPSSPAVATKAS